MGAKPVWLLDIDGVLNATATNIPSTWPGSSWHRVHIDGFQITWSDKVVDFLKHVDAEGLAEIRWHTTWQERALDVGEAMGLPEFPVQEAPEWPPTGEKVADWIRAARPSWWKYGAAEQVLTVEKRPLLWTDDDIWSSLNAIRRQMLKKLGSVKMISPECIWGLQPGHLRDISRWLQQKNR